MSPEAQRIAIAEWCGWTKCRLTIRGAGAPERYPSPHGVPPSRKYECPLPSYLNDLNAMHEAEERTGVGYADEYALQLEKLCKASYTRIWHATAAQRAEALLRTIGKWQE